MAGPHIKVPFWGIGNLAEHLWPRKLFFWFEDGKAPSEEISTAVWHYPKTQCSYLEAPLTQ